MGSSPGSDEEGQPDILDAVRDQNGVCWLRYGDHRRAIWFALSDLPLASQNGLLKRLIDIDARFVRPAFLGKFRDTVGGERKFRPALVASMPGWLEGIYVRGDGTVIKAPVDPREAFVTFEPHQKFRCQGSLRQWQKAVGPIVKDQPLALFALSLGLAGFLMRYAPLGALNPMFEIAGDPGTGKSTIGFLMMSVTAGNQLSAHGGGESWNFSPSQLDVLKRTHRDGPVLLDEANLGDSDEKKLEHLTARTVFSMSSTEERQRFRDEDAKPSSFVSFLSTTNQPLAALIKRDPATRGAILQRMITIQISKDSRYGVLTHLPDRFATSREAIAKLDTATRTYWGSAGREFAREIADRVAVDEFGFKEKVERDYLRQREKLAAITDVPRLQDSFARVIVAGRLAQEWGILPKRWGRIGPLIRGVARQSVGKPVTEVVTADQVIRAYLQAHWRSFVKVANIAAPHEEAAFNSAAGFVRESKGVTQLLISTKRLNRKIYNCIRIMKELRGQGLAKTEGGSQSKLSIKTPPKICRSGRVYCINLVNELADMKSILLYDDKSK